jgi:hypothetical protein
VKVETFHPKPKCARSSIRGQRGGRNTERDFHGEKRRNDTHSSTTDADARLFRKAAGKEAKLCYMGHLMMENRRRRRTGDRVNRGFEEMCCIPLRIQSANELTVTPQLQGGRPRL